MPLLDTFFSFQNDFNTLTRIREFNSIIYLKYRSSEQPEGKAVEQDAHIEGALAAEASLVVLDTLETVVQADGGGGIK